MTTTNHLNKYEKLDSEILESHSKIADELLEVENLDLENTEYLARLLFCLERYDESIDQFKKVMSLKNDMGNAFMFIGINYFWMCNYAVAIEYFNLAVETDPENETLLSYLMISYELLKDYECAVRWGERILEYNPKNDSVITRLIDYHFECKNYEECLSYISRTDYRDHYKKALILYGAKRYEECITEAGKIRTAESYRLTGRAYHKLGNNVKAVKHLHMSYEKDSGVDVLFEISDIYLEVEDYSRAIHFLKMVLLHDDANIEANKRIAEACLNTTKWYDAVEYAKKVIEINENVPETYITLAEAYFQLEESYEKANMILDEAISKNPDSSMLWAQKGGYNFPNDMFEFRRSFEKAISLNPRDLEIYRDYIYLLLLGDDEQVAKKFYNEMLLYNPLYGESFDEFKKSRFLSN